MTATKRLFHFTVTYFKPSGKYYTHTAFDFECTDCGPDGHPSAYMNDVVDHITQLRDRTNRAMPGLTGQWRGHILIQCEQGFPCLIPSIQADTE